MVKTPVLACQNLGYSYKGSDKPALQGITLSINSGELYGLIGPNGAGKTTLVSLVTTLLSPCEGTLFLCGIDAVKKPTLVQKQIGIVPQDLALYNKLTGYENILYFSSMYGLKKKSIKERAHHYLGMFGLMKKSNQRVSTYSGGMKRRLNIIIGTLHDPEIIFLDEPTVGIDAQSRHLIMERLLELNENGTAMIYVSHYMEEIEKLCDKILIIDEGKLVAQGTPPQLVKRHEGCNNIADVYLEMTGERLRD